MAPSSRPPSRGCLRIRRRPTCTSTSPPLAATPRASKGPEPGTGNETPYCQRAAATSCTRMSLRLRLRRWRQRDRGLAGDQKKCERLLQVEAHGGVGVAQIADGDILADMQVEIAAAGGQHEAAGDGGRPDDPVADPPFGVR